VLRELWADTHFVSPADMEGLLSRIETVPACAARAMGAEVSGVCEDPFPYPRRAHHGDVAHNEDAEPVTAPHRRKRPPRRLLVAAAPAAKAVIVGDPVQAVVRVRLAPAASRRGFEQYVRTLTCVRTDGR